MEVDEKPAARTTLDIETTSGDVLRTCREVLGSNGGKIDTTVYKPSDETKEFSILHGNPPKATDLTPSELLPQTPSLYIKTKEEAFSPQLLEFCLQKPIVVIRNLGTVCDMDLSLYSTKTLVQAHPSHPVEIRTQMEQTADENWDPTMSKQVWYCTSSRSHTTIAKYAEYQASNLQEALASMKGKLKSVNPEFDFSNSKTRRMIKFGTNCDLSDEKKWGPQLRELTKLPAW